MKKTFTISLLGAALVVIGFVACTSGPSRPSLPTVSSVNLERYSGKWFEIASYPAWFQRGCSHVTAHYSPLPDGTIRIVNTCRKGGTDKKIEGTATPVDGSNGSKLKVRFGVPIDGDYWLIALDQKNYQWAVVGHPSRKYLWILSRTPTIDPALYQRLQDRVKALGYDPAKLLKTDQS